MEFKQAQTPEKECSVQYEISRSRLSELKVNKIWMQIVKQYPHFDVGQGYDIIFHFNEALLFLFFESLCKSHHKLVH